MRMFLKRETFLARFPTLNEIYNKMFETKRNETTYTLKVIVSLRFMFFFNNTIKLLTENSLRKVW